MSRASVPMTNCISKNQHRIRPVEIMPRKEMIQKLYAKNFIEG